MTCTYTDLRPVAAVCPHPHQTGLTCELIHLSPCSDNMLVCGTTKWECALSQRGDVLNHVSNDLLIYLVKLHPTIDVTGTKQIKTKADN